MRTSSLIFSQHLELSDTFPPEDRQSMQPAQRRRWFRILGHQAFREKVGDPVGESLPQNDIERSDQVEEKRGTTGKQHFTTSQYVPPGIQQEAKICLKRPEGARPESRFVVWPDLDSNDLEKGVGMFFHRHRGACR